MNCFNHPPQMSVVQCVDCGKGLCPECAGTYSLPICNVCNKKRIDDETGEIIGELLMTFVFGLVISFFLVKWWLVDDSINYNWAHFTVLGMFFFYVSAGIIAGWRTLNSITPQVFLILPLLGWVVYFILKLFLAFWVGLIALPIRTIRGIVKLVSLNKIST